MVGGVISLSLGASLFGFSCDFELITRDFQFITCDVQFIMFDLEELDKHISGGDENKSSYLVGHEFFVYHWHVFLLIFGRGIFVSFGHEFFFEALHLVLPGAD